MKKNQQKSEIIGIIFFTLALICSISLINPEAGLVSKFIEWLLRIMAGEGRYLFPLLLIFFGLRTIKAKRRVKGAARFYGGSLLFIVALTLVHMIIPRSYTLEAGLRGDGGGLVGAVFGYVLRSSFGQAGTYIILATLVLVGLLLSSNVSLDVLFKKIAGCMKKLYNKSKNFINNYLFEEVETSVEPVIIDQSGAVGGDEAQQESAEEPPKPKAKNVVVVRPENNQRDIFKTLVSVESECLATAEPSKHQLPGLNLLSMPVRSRNVKMNKDIAENIRVLEDTLESFGIKARVTQVARGPTITRYEIQPPAGIKVSRIINLADDIALSMAAPDVRIEAPIPGKAAVGIEVPNREVSVVYLRELLETEKFQTTTFRLTVALGKDITGNPVITDLARMPHLLIAGATGSGKSVCLNTIIASILFKATPDEVKFLIIDPKMVELSNYNGIPHLIMPVVTNPKRAAASLRWVVKEMEYRYGLFAAAGVRDINRYNNNNSSKAIPLMVIVIDELSDLMMVAPSDVEDAICRLAQMARAAGIHLVVATQRPSVDVITGLIKANIPSRISFAVSSQIDSRTILDMAGAEKLLGRGDMLFYPVGAAKPVRLQGAYLSDKEVETLVAFLTERAQPDYDQRFIEEISKGENAAEVEDELLPKAAEILIRAGHASISLLQRRMRIGYARAARLIDIMERKGIVGAYEGSKPREVLMTIEQYQQTFKKV